jgi:hypothetical protein
MVRVMTHASDPDFTSLARRPTERLKIVEHVRDTLTLEETDYLEWKSEYDLSTKVGAVLTARQLIGMANRDPAQAKRHAEGSAYMLEYVRAEHQRSGSRAPRRTSSPETTRSAATCALPPRHHVGGGKVKRPIRDLLSERP